MSNRKNFWVTVCLFNLGIVALLGLGLRSKILFTIPEIDFRKLESAHSHFAFAGWAGLSLITLLIHDLLPSSLSQKKIYNWFLILIQVSALGMAILFPFYGYNTLTIFFSTLYIAVTVVFIPVYIRDLRSSDNPVVVKLLAYSSIASLLLSYLGTLGLVYILASGSGNSFLYRDSIYTFLHFQYNGFFTLAIFALVFKYFALKAILPSQAKPFAVFLSLSVIPTLFLSLLWHNNDMFYVLAAIGSIMIIIILYFFIRLINVLRHMSFFASSRLSNLLWIFAAVSFALKMILNAGTITPSLSDMVYGDRPIIIGFLHLVFLGFLSFFLLANFIARGYFTRKGSVVSFPILLFTTGIFLNEILLMTQGLGILLNMNSETFKWLLWIAAILLLLGAVLIFFTRLSVWKENKKGISEDMP